MNRTRLQKLINYLRIIFLKFLDHTFKHVSSPVGTCDNKCTASLFLSASANVSTNHCNCPYVSVFACNNHLCEYNMKITNVN